MADVAISGLTALGAAPATTDLIPLVDVSDTTQALTGTTKKMTVANLFTAPHFTTPVVDSGGLTVTSGNLTVPSGTMTAGSQISTTTGSLEARGAVFSYTDLVGVYAEYVSGTTQARLGAKHPTAAGLVLATVTGGAKVDALTFTAAGAATFAGTVAGTKIINNGAASFGSALVATAFQLYADATYGAALAGFGTTADTTLLDRGGNPRVQVTSALTTVTNPLNVTGAVSVSATSNNVTLNVQQASAGTYGLITFQRNGVQKAALALDAGDTFSMYNAAAGTPNWGWTDAGAFSVRGTLSVGASTTAGPSLKVPSGTAPTSPSDGDLWYDGTNVKFRVGGTTKTFTLT